MGTSILGRPEIAGHRAAPATGKRFGEMRFALGWVSVLTVYAFLVHGYHPYAEDGGMYAAGVKRVLDPTLYTRSPEFVEAYLRLSAFAPTMAWLTRTTHLSVDAVLLGVHLLTLWGTLFAAWMLAERCFRSREARAGAVAMLAAWFTMPVAGTALVLMDPYVTARSLSTPFTLLALVGALDWTDLRPVGWRVADGRSRSRGRAMCLGSLALALAMHPLMGGYAVGIVAVVLCTRASSEWIRRWGVALVAGLAVASAAALQAFSPAESAAYLRVAMTRRYWFPGNWAWYELFGLIAPLMIVGAGGFLSRRGTGVATHEGDTAGALGRMAFWVGAMAMAVALLFARMGTATHMVARLQPLRAFEIVYMVMTLGLGALLGERVLARRPGRWVAALVLLGGVMFYAQRQTYPASQHVEGVWGAPSNEWTQAFLWIRGNTPKDALFAMDARYITLPGEDGHGFRAIAERSVLADFSKDGGEAANSPRLTEAWTRGQALQDDLSGEKDAQRLALLAPVGVSWVVLEEGARTGWKCPFRNIAVEVCEVPGTDSGTGL